MVGKWICIDVYTCKVHQLIFMITNFGRSYFRLLKKKILVVGFKMDLYVDNFNSWDIVEKYFIWTNASKYL